MLSRDRSITLVRDRPHRLCSAAFAKQIAEIEAGCAARDSWAISTPRRDSPILRDTVRAYRLIAERGVPGRPYNICTGKAVAVQDVLDVLVSQARVFGARRRRSRTPSSERHAAGAGRSPPVRSRSWDGFRVPLRADGEGPARLLAGAYSRMTRRRELATVTAFVTLLTVALSPWSHASCSNHHRRASRSASQHLASAGLHALHRTVAAVQRQTSSILRSNTLAFSDATMLQGLLGAPLFWIGAPPVLIYNLLLLAGFAGSGLATYLLARHVTGSMGASLVANIICTVLPCPHRTRDAPRAAVAHVRAAHVAGAAQGRRARLVALGGVAAGLCSGFRCWRASITVSSLAMVLLAFVPALLIASGRNGRWRSARTGRRGRRGRRAHGSFLRCPTARRRSTSARVHSTTSRSYSATPVNYLSTSALSWVWGWTADRRVAPELRLFPGIAAVLLALFAVVRRPRHLAWVYLATTLLAIELSLGLNGPGYRCPSST